MYLNLARKWRSKKFEEVIGQDFAIKILKNCLYRDLVSPVYLISGPKGCGKTTVARLFAAALNCENLSTFKANPKNVSLPCSACHSCFLFNKSAHPDFIEIDAASNTGVENVRQIIDSTSFIPALGNKRIYLIDEAHMLSKAAFNALLKTLEEPPASVLFILATTEVNKIIETVRSRCFQLFFSPIDKESLLTYLMHICKTEQIEFDIEALKFIVQESQGSARDALNLLEKVRAGFDIINKEVVFKALGFLAEEDMLLLFELLLRQNAQEVISFYLDKNLQFFDQFIFFKKMVALIYSAITLKMNLSADLSETLSNKLKDLVGKYAIDFFIKMLDLCYASELILLKTANPSILIQNLLIKLCSIGSDSKSNTGSFKSDSEAKTPLGISTQKIEMAPSSTFRTKITSAVNDSVGGYTSSEVVSSNKEWHQFLIELEKANDPLLLSIFKQGHFKLVDTVIHLSFNKELVFFKDCLERSKHMWRPLLNNVFKSETMPTEIGIELVFNNVTKNVPISPAQPTGLKIEPVQDSAQSFAKKIEVAIKPDYSRMNEQRIFKKNSTKATLQDKTIQIDLEKFPKVNIISKIFPGRVTSSVAIDNTLERKHE